MVSKSSHFPDNRISNLSCAGAPWNLTPYDAAGNQLCDNDKTDVRQYVWDAENRISQINLYPSTNPAFVTYTYGADGARVHKQNADGTFTEYLDFAGQTIAEKDQAGTWTDYVFANGQRIAKVGGYEARIRTSATSNGNPSTLSWNLPLPVRPDGSPYVIASGDQLCFRQISNNGYGGPVATFSNDTSTLGTGWIASDGQPLSHFTTQDAWVRRCIDLSGGGQTTGSTVSLAVLRDFPTPVGYADLWYADMTITSLDGTITPILTSSPSFGSGTDFEGDYANSGAVAVVEVFPATGVDTFQPIRFYVGDHLGSAQMEFSANGTPISASQFMPFGGEINPPVTANHYKFTGKERDSESGLDYFGARYYASSMGRWMSPDWSAKEEPVPYSKLDNPQTLNLYSYVVNNPLSQIDDDGHEIIYADGLKNAQLVKDTVTAILANPNTSGNLSGYVGPNAPNLTIQNGDLSYLDSATQNPDGTPGGSITKGLLVPSIQTGDETHDGVESRVTKLTDATMTIDNRTSKGDTIGVVDHESVHAGDAIKNPAQYLKTGQEDKNLPHDSRRHEQHAMGVEKATTGAITKAVKQIEKDRKKDQQ